MRITPRDPRAVFWIMGLLAGAALANLGQLPSMENQESTSYRAFVRSNTASMAAIGLESSPTVRDGRGVYLWLSELARGADVVLPEGTGFDEWQLHGFAGVRRIIPAEGSTEGFLAGLDVSEHVVAHDDNGRYGPFPFTIALADKEPEVLVVRVVGDRRDLIDMRLLPDSARAKLPQ